MQNPKVTVITVVYNIIEADRRETFLQCVESVKAQTYKNIEHIIIDGASTDGTLELIQSLNIAYYSEPDTSLYDAMNKGINKASGKYIAFLNSDDFWHSPTGVEESIKALEESDADFSCASTTFIRENDAAARIADPILGLFFMRMPFCHQSMFTKVAYLKEIGMFDLSYKSAADYDLVMRMIMRGAKPVVVPHNFTSYRLSGLSSIDRELSIKESIHSCEQNLAPLISHSQDYRLLFELHTVSAVLVKEIYTRVHKVVQASMIEYLANASIENGYYKILKSPPHKSEEISNELQQSIEEADTERFAQIQACKEAMKYTEKTYSIFNFPCIRFKKNAMHTKISFLAFPLLQRTRSKEPINMEQAENFEIFNDLYKLFGYLPLMRIKHSRRHTRWYLLSYIPILLKAENKIAKKYYLFNKIPFLTIAMNGK